MKSPKLFLKRLRDLIVMTAPLETTMGDALRASEALALKLDLPGSFAAAKRVEALLVLHGFVTWLLRARSSERAKAFGLGW